MYNLTSVKRWSFAPPSGTALLNLSRDGNRVLLADNRKNLYLLDKRGKELWQTPLPAKPIMLSISESGEFAAVICENSSLQLYDSHGTEFLSLKLDNGICTLDINEEDKLVVVGSALKRIYLFRLDGALVFKRKANHTIFDIRFAPTANGIAALSTIGDLSFFDYNGDTHWGVALKRRALGLDISKSGRFVVVPIYEGGVMAYNLFGDYIGMYDVMANVSCVTVNGSGKLMYLADNQNRLILLNQNAEVIWNETFPNRIVKIDTDNTGALCLLQEENGEATLIELVEEQTPQTDFLEFSEIPPEIEAKVLWRKDYNHLYPKNTNLQTAISHDGGNLAVLGRNRVSVYRDNGLLRWNDTIEDNNAELFTIYGEPFFFVNTQDHLYKYSYRDRLLWKMLLRFDKLHVPYLKGMLYSTSKNSIFAIDHKGEIRWQKDIEHAPLGASVSQDGSFFAVRPSKSQIIIFNNIGGILTKLDVSPKLTDFHFLSRQFIMLRGNQDIFAKNLVSNEEKFLRLPEPSKKIFATSNLSVFAHMLGGATGYNSHWVKQFDLPNEQSKMILIQDLKENPLIARVSKRQLRLYDQFGRQLWKFESRKLIDLGTLKSSAGRMIFFADRELFFLETGKTTNAAKVTNFIEFNTKRRQSL